MAHRTLDSLSFGQPRAGQSHTHQVIDVKESLEKQEDPKTPEPQCHNVLDLTKFLERTINVSSGVIDSALGRKRTALDLLRNRFPFPDNYTFPDSYFFSGYHGPPQPHSLSSNHDHAAGLDLAWLFAIFNTIFFMNALPTNTRIDRQISVIFEYELRVTLSEQGDNFFSRLAFVDNVHAGFKKRVDKKFLPPTIDVPSSVIDRLGAGHVDVTWEDQVGSLLGSMIDLFIQYYSCRQDECWNNKYTHGKKHRGAAWQIIAYRFEKSSTMKKPQETLGSPINLKRKEDYEWDLNHWSSRELDSLESKLLCHRIETWGWAPYNQLSCVRAVQERKRSQARYEERRQAMVRNERMRQDLTRDEERPQATARGPENHTELGESQYGGSDSRSREDGSRFGRIRSPFRS
ncbi:uncharacterized protein EAF02_001684 [Botrytis sinoallii]|uniref:uncharacterized protein n=1 Tax=Botrytis sinoallii TaxID=1463999 RepID=UPI0019003406|nr:uncharacterized protein EAF02_001684 [Botrytis sinoallii]KAF7891359.1 hypothetical protein EAF02_001684 [Botrytis sinoallii]